MLTRRFFILFSLCIVMALSAVLWPIMLSVTKIVLMALGIITLADIFIVTLAAFSIKATRSHSDKMSFDQPNRVSVNINLKMPERLKSLFSVVSYDTLPRQCVSADSDEMRGEGTFTYSAVPKSRGRHEFGIIRSFIKSPIGLCEGKRFTSTPTVVNVYPTFHNLGKLELIATQHNTQVGQQRLRRAGNNTDFDQIRAYVKGDDIRTINWKATARTATLMVNTYTDERSQPIIPILCSGPSMLVATEGVSLLDRATSAAIALASSAIRHYDEVGLITASHRGVDTYLRPERSSATVSKLLMNTFDFGLPPTPSEQSIVNDPDVIPDGISEEVMSKLKDRMDTCTADTDFDAVADYVIKHIRRKSLLLLFANFENLEIAKIILPALQKMNKKHRLVVILFTNEGVESVAMAPYRGDKRASQKLSEMRFRTLCADYLEQQMKLATNLRKQHINVILTSPNQLTSAILSKYLELKDQGAL